MLSIGVLRRNPAAESLPETPSLRAVAPPPPNMGCRTVTSRPPLRVRGTERTTIDACPAPAAGTRVGAACASAPSTTLYSLITVA